jgi:hypothetical protein
MDKSPLKTLTLEDFLESERHKLTGTLTPVTPETFAKWKSERMDKKAAEEQARAAREATGRAMFEKGGWGEDEEEDDEEDGEDDDAWNMERLRQETEALREKKEAERIAKLSGGVVTTSGNEDQPEPDDTNGIEGSVDGSADTEDGAANGTKDREANGAEDVEAS